MKKLLMPEVKQYFKANLHTHTTITEGTWTPEQVKENYKAQGYQVVAFTDHYVCVPHPELDDAQFLALTGYELMSQLSPDGKVYHFNFFAKERDNRWQIVQPGYAEMAKAWHAVYDKIEELFYNIDRVNEVIQKANEKGFLVSYNHPQWSLQNYPDYAGLKNLWGIEVYNSYCSKQGYEDNHAIIYQDLLKLNNRLYPLATDDLHEASRAFGGWIMIGAAELSYPSVMEALEKGDFYATTGPNIYSLYVEDTILHISCSEAVRISMLTNGRMNEQVAAKNGEPLTEATFHLTDWWEAAKENNHANAFVRFAVTDAHGHTAYTRAFYPEELK